MSASAIHQQLKTEGFLGRLLALPADVYQMFGRKHHAVPPLNDSAVASTADEPHIPAAHDLGVDVGHEVFLQTKRIGRDGRLFLHSHCNNVPRNCLPHEASGKNGTTVDFPTLNFHSSTNFRFRDASCSIVELQKSNAALRANNFGASA